MRREILEATFPGITGEYHEDDFKQGWTASFVKKVNVYQIIVINGKFSAQTLIKGVYCKCNPIPLKAISLLAKYIEQ